MVCLSADCRSKPQSGGSEESGLQAEETAIAETLTGECMSDGQGAGVATVQ